MIGQCDHFINRDPRLWFDLLSEGIILTDEKMRVTYVNPSYLEYSGLVPENIVGEILSKIRTGGMLSQVLKTGKSLLNVHRKIDNTESYVDYFPVFHEKQLIGSIIVVRSAKLLAQLFDQLKEKNDRITQLDQRLKSIFRSGFSFDDIIGRNLPFVKTAQKAAQGISPVLLTGASGTGKEVLAQSIHGASRFAEGPFIDLNCAAIPEALMESELFGYSPGAFTDANKAGKVGLFELANEGTLFLDEITELSPKLQSKLLRVLEEKELRRVGDNRKIPLNVRIIAATNQDIEKLVASGAFRDDLFYRLAVFVISIPPLRERNDEIPEFAKRALEEQGRKDNCSYDLSSEAISVLKAYDWPGNIRELKNALEYACNMVEGTIIQPNNLPLYVFRKGKFSSMLPIWQQDQKATLTTLMNESEKQILKMRLSDFNSTMEGRRKLAENLGISIATLYNKLRKHNLEDK